MMSDDLTSANVTYNVTQCLDKVVYSDVHCV